MKYLLDANTCIEHFRRGGASPVTIRILATPRNDIVLCSIVRGELMAGALKSLNPQAGISQIHQFASGFQSLPFDDASADAYGEIRAHLERIGQPIGPNDLFIAAIAVANRIVLVTNNLREFSRVPGLTCEDWTVPLVSQP